MPSVVLNKITQPQLISSSDIYDKTAPLSYKDWIRNNIGIIPEDSQQQYERYLTEFYSQKTQSNLAHGEQLRQDYINLIKRLSIVFKNDKEFQRFSKINFDSPIELKLAIPYFSKKLKDIAIYFAQKRDSLKQTKLQYASVGSETGLERFLYSRLLEAFSQNIPLNSDDQTFLDDTTIKELQKNLKIEIEELYEDHNYYTDGIALDINPLFCVLDNLIFNFCEQDNIFTRSSVDPTQKEYLCVEDEMTINELVSEGWSVYTSNDLNYITGGEGIRNIFDVNLSLNSDNNFFYWFSGEAIQEIPEGVFGDVSLSSINWEDATAGSDIDSADILFATYGNIKTEGAWLMSADKVTFNTTMTATMKDGKEFKFPYPGLGLSAENGEWSGRLLTDLTEDDKRFFPNEALFQENIKNIQNLYWSAATSISSITDIFIQDLLLWESGAHPSINFKTADKIILRSETGPDKLHDSFPNEVYQGNLDIAWLYDFRKTQIPIVQEQSNLYFPLTSFSDVNDLYFKYDRGAAIPLSSIKVNGAFTGAIAGTDIENSDFIIKKNSSCGPELEAAWLEGTPLSAFRDDDPDFCLCDDTNKFITSTDWVYTRGVSQPGISFKADPNSIVKFVWTGPTTPISEIKGFNGFIHDDTCPYNNLNHSQSILDNSFKTFNKESAEKWKKCTCRSVYHCPIGQKAAAIDQFNIIPDLILEEIDASIPPNISSWRGRDGKTYQDSTDATWFQLENSIDKDVGWGEGRWTNSFKLKQGKTYWYYRTNLNRCDIDLPFFVINECYAELVTKCDQRSNIPVWRKAVKTSEGNWVKTNLVSDMTLSYGTFYEYIHRPNHSWAKSRIRIDGEYVTSEEFITVNRIVDSFGFDIRTDALQSVEFLIKIPLENNRPYWGTGTYEFGPDTNDKKILRNYNDNRLVGTYLISNQAIPSDIILSDGDVIRYESAECNDCFIWRQPITMNVEKPIRQWNKLLFSDCVKSDILNYLHDNCYDNCNNTTDLCGCENICTSFKSGMTATNEPSDMIFNVDLSGVPLFINYYARQPFDVTVQIEDLINPLYTPVMSGNLSEAILPWRNLINDRDAVFVSEQNSEHLKTLQELGIFTPNNLAMGKYELHSADHLRNFNSEMVFRDDNYFDGPFSPININSEWMKSNIGLPQVNGFQTYHPYQSNYTLGLYTDDYPLSPWESDDYQIGCAVEDYFTTVKNITSNVVDWATDIYGNQFFLNSPYEKLSFDGVGTLYTKIGNTILAGAESLSAIFNRYEFEEVQSLTNINSIKIFYDTLQIVHTLLGSNQLITFDKLDWNYDTSEYDIKLGGLRIDMGDDNIFIGTILQNNTKKTYTFVLDYSTSVQKIICYEYDINKHILKNLSILSDDSWVDFGMVDMFQKPSISFFNNIIYIIFGTVGQLHLFKIRLDSTISFLEGKSYDNTNSIYVDKIIHNNDGIFILTLDGNQYAPFKLE